MRRHAFPGRGPDVDARYERAGLWLLATVFENGAARDLCGQKGIKIERATGEGIGTAGGWLVPRELADAILDMREIYGAFRRRARIQPMKSDTISVPRRTGAANSSQVFFMSENVAGAQTNFVVDAVDITAQKLGAIILLSSELEEDSLRDIVDYVANEMAWGFASKEDDCAFNGDGSGTYGGMRGIIPLALDGSHNKAKVVAASGHNTYAQLDATDMGNLMAAVRASAIPNAAWFISQTGFALSMCRPGIAYLDYADIDGIRTPLFLGFPVILVQKLPLVTTALTTNSGMVAFGDMYAAGILGQRRGITISRTPERYLDTDQIGLLGTERFEAVIHDMGDNTNPGALAVLLAP